MSNPEKNSGSESPLTALPGYGELRVLLPADLAAAWQRCSWVLVQEKGQTRLDSMEEMVRDFLIKHGC
ncbi:MAG: hypothetical protein ACR2PB_15145 [Desulfocapsaceae bacterium]